MMNDNKHEEKNMASRTEEERWAGRNRNGMEWNVERWTVGDTRAFIMAFATLEY